MQLTGQRAFPPPPTPPASRFWLYAHGVCWQELCTDLQVIDVPGDHFSLLRQGARDMAYLVEALQAALGAFGWDTVLRAGNAGGGWELPAEEVSAAGVGGGKAVDHWWTARSLTYGTSVVTQNGHERKELTAARGRGAFQESQGISLYCM